MALVLFGHYHPVHTFQLSATTSSWARTSTSYASRSRMYAAAEAAADDTASRGNNDVLLLSTQKTLWRNSWTSWWCQFPLSIVSTVILIFARSILLNSTSSTDAIRKEAAGLFLTGTGIFVSFLSTFWTWGGTRLASRVKRPETTKIAAATMMRRFVKVGVALNLVGMGLHLGGAGTIIGGLAIKVLSNTQQQGILIGSGATMIQPLDILVVQANTNGMLSHFISLCFFLFVEGIINNLDPPSVEGNERTKRTLGK